MSVALPCFKDHLVSATFLTVSMITLISMSLEAGGGATSEDKAGLKHFWNARPIACRLFTIYGEHASLDHLISENALVPSGIFLNFLFLGVVIILGSFTDSDFELSFLALTLAISCTHLPISPRWLSFFIYCLILFLFTLGIKVSAPKDADIQKRSSPSVINR